MAKKVFFSFHYKPDCFRVAQVRNSWMIEGNPAANDNDWETIKKGGDAAIQRWIDGQLAGRSCTVVLIGTNTATRQWVKYEIVKSWNEGKGVVGVHIHNLKDINGYLTPKGANPFTQFTMNGYGNRPLATVVKTYDPPGADSKMVYAAIKGNLAMWIEQAIKIRKEWR
jgi:hypothetical protein